MSMELAQKWSGGTETPLKIREVKDKDSLRPRQPEKLQVIVLRNVNIIHLIL